MLAVPSFIMRRHSKRFSVINEQIGLLLYLASAFISLTFSSIVLFLLSLVMNSARATSSKLFSGKFLTRSSPLIAVVSSTSGPLISLSFSFPLNLILNLKILISIFRRM